MMWGENLVNEIMPRSNKIRTNEGQLLAWLMAYNRRQLTYEADALNAVKGILSRNSFFTYLGLIIGRHGALDTSTQVPAPPTGEDAVGRMMAPFLVTLSWSTKGMPLKRRYAFPSWSWLGWEGEVELWDYRFQYLDHTATLQARVWITKYDTSPSVPMCKSQTQEDELVPLAQIAQEHMLQEGKEPSQVIPHCNNYIWVEGAMMNVSFELRHCVGIEGQLLQVRDCSLGNRLLYLTYSYVDFRTLQLPTGDRNSPLFQRIVTEEWECLMISGHPWLGSFELRLLILEPNKHQRDDVTEADDYYCVVGTVNLVVGLEGDDNSSPYELWEDVSLRRVAQEESHRRIGESLRRVCKSLRRRIKLG